MRRSHVLLFTGSSGGWLSTTLSNALLFCNYHLLQPIPAALATTTSTLPSTPIPAVSTTAMPWWGSLFPDPMSTHSYGTVLFQLLHHHAVPPGSAAAVAAAAAGAASAFYYPFASLFLAGAIFRLLTIPLTIWGEGALLRLRGARPHLCEAYRQYMVIANHPDAIAWEKRVAAQKLRNDRQRIFTTFRTNNLLAYIPFLAAGGLNVGVLFGPVVGGQLGPFLVQHSIPSAAGSVAAAGAGAGGVLPTAVAALSTAAYAPSPLLFCIGGGSGVGGGAIAAAAATTTTTLTASSSSSLFFCLVDPTLSLAALVSWWNAKQHLQLRQGMGAKAEAVRRQGETVSRRVLLWVAAVPGLLVLPAWSAALCMGGGATSSAALAAAPLLVVLPSYIAPAWLGMALTTAVKTFVVRRWRAEAYAPVIRHSASAAASDEDVAQEAEDRQQQQQKMKSGGSRHHSDSTISSENNAGASPATANQEWSGDASHHKNNNHKNNADEVNDNTDDDDRLDTSQGHPYKLSFTGEDVEERRGMWKIQRRMLEYECDVRLFRMFRKLWTRAEELEEEAEKLQRKASIARARRLQRQQPQRAGEDGGDDVSDPPPQRAAGQSMTADEARELRMVVEAQAMRNAVYDQKEKRRQERAKESNDDVK